MLSATHAAAAFLARFSLLGVRLEVVRRTATIDLAWAINSLYAAAWILRSGLRAITSATSSLESSSSITGQHAEQALDLRLA